MIGELQRSGVGVEVEAPLVRDAEWLKANAAQRNKALIGKLKEDKNAVRLLEETEADAELARMSKPIPVESCDLDSVLLHPRFGVEQEQLDGRVKVKAVDHFSWSTGRRGKEDSVNGHVAPGEKMSHDTMDYLAQVMAVFVALVGEVPGLEKADIKSAFRRIPIRPDQRWACGVAFMIAGQVLLLVSWQVTFCYV